MTFGQCARDPLAPRARGSPTVSLPLPAALVCIRGKQSGLAPWGVGPVWSLDHVPPGNPSPKQQRCGMWFVQSSLSAVWAPGPEQAEQQVNACTCTGSRKDTGPCLGFWRPQCFWPVSLPSIPGSQAVVQAAGGL